MMTKNQFIEVAKAGFPDHVKATIDFEQLEMHHMSGVFRLYYKDTPFVFMLPSEDILSICIENKTSFVQIQPRPWLAFDHYAAIKKMEQLGLV